MKRLELLMLGLMMSISAFAQTGTISGKVTTADGRPVADVTVIIRELQRGTATDEAGYFFFNKLKADSYTLVISHTGLQTKEQTAIVSDNKEFNITVSLSETTKELEAVIVNSPRNLNSRAVSAGKIAIDPMDLPQSITIVNSSLMREQQAQRLSDVIRNVNGVYLSGSRASTQETFSARGYSLGANNLFRNGARVNSSFMPEMSSLERVEVLKGSAAILYGNVAPGGIINMVSKQPKFVRGGDVSVRTGSYGLFKPSVDLYGPVSKNIAVRLNGTYETADSYRDVVHSERYYVNPSLLVKLGKHTELIAQGDYLSHNFTPDFGIGSINNTTITPVSRNTFFGTTWQYAKVKQGQAGLTLKQQLNGAWTLNVNTTYQRYSRDYFSTERIQAAANADWARPLGRTNTAENYLIGQIDINGKFKTGTIGHQLLAGVDGERYLTKAYTYQLARTIYDTINLLDPNKFVPRSDIPAATALRFTETPVLRTGAYVQDLISITDKLSLLVGVRWSLQEARRVDTTNLQSGNKATGGAIKTDMAFSPRAGIVYKITPCNMVFASYANSFTVNSGTDVYGGALPPSIIDQFELGVKNDFLRGNLSVNITAYRIINHNLAQTAQFAADGTTPNNNTSLKELTGETTSDGIEVDIAGRPFKGLDITAGYSYNYMRYTQTPDAKGNYVEGERLVNNPAHTANATVFYTFKSFRAGASVVYVGDRVGGWNNTIGQAQNYDRRIPVEGFATLDLTAGYSYKQLSFLVKVSNVTNTYNYYVHENYSVNPIPPTQVIGTVAYKLK